MFYSFSVQCCVGHCLSLPLFLLIIGCCISPSICGFWYHFNIFKTYQKCQTLRWFRVYGVSSLSTVFRLYLTNVSPFHIYIPFLFILCANELHLNNIIIYKFYSISPNLSVRVQNVYPYPTYQFKHSISSYSTCTFFMHIAQSLTLTFLVEMGTGRLHEGSVFEYICTFFYM